MPTRSSFCLVAAVLLAVAPSSALEPWEDDLKNYNGTVEITVPQGYQTVAAPSAGAATKGVVAGPVKVAVVGFVEAGGQRFYLSEEERDQWLDAGEAPTWIAAGGTEQLPALPKLLKRGPGEDPDTGEEVMIEAYEETVAILPESRWPAETAQAEKFFPAALLAVGGDDSGNTIATFQLFLNSDASTAGYPFAQPSYRELTSGQPGARVRLYSRAEPVNVRLIVSGQSQVLPLLQPGLVFLAGFSEGSLVRLSIGGDAWSETAPVSRLGAPVFRRDEALAFGFLATEIKGAGVPFRILPDRIGGADYTQYGLISQMGAPFDEYSPAETQDSWTLHIERDLTTTLLAPLWDGRGAPGMLELEGLSLDVAPPGPDPENFTEEDYAAFRHSLPAKTDPSLFGEGWRSILDGKLGEIPAAQRVPETEGGEF